MLRNQCHNCNIKYSQKIALLLVFFDFVVLIFLLTFVVRQFFSGVAMKHNVYILTGGNQGEVVAQLRLAKQHLIQRLGELVVASSIYETEPWGMPLAPMFMNQVLCFSSALHPMEMIKATLEIEREMGRTRVPGVPGSRNIDIDILFIDGMIISEPGLEVPHPRMHLRRFALKPLCDIAPDFIHPIFGKSISYLLSICGDPLIVSKLDKKSG